MFVVKRLGKNGMWSAVSLIDGNGSFRGEAKFETLEEAEEYMAIYLERMKNRPSINHDGIRVFDESKPAKGDEEPKKGIARERAPRKPGKPRKIPKAKKRKK